MKNLVLLIFMIYAINVHGQTYQRALVRQELTYPAIANEIRKGISFYQAEYEKKITYCTLYVDKEDEYHRNPFICEVFFDTDTIEFDDGYKYYMEIDSIPFLISEGQDYFETCNEEKTFTFKQTRYFDYCPPIFNFNVKKVQNPPKQKHYARKPLKRKQYAKVNIKRKK